MYRPVDFRRVIDILAGNAAYCNVCLIPIEEENSYCFEDEITLNSDAKSMKFSELASSILGFSVISFCASGIVCRQCMELTITSFKFIQMCKCNTEQLRNAVTILGNGINNVDEPNSDQKTLYITMYRYNWISQYTFEDDTAPDNSHKSLQGLQGICVNKSTKTETIQEYSIELESIDMSKDDVKFKEKLPKKTKQSKKINNKKRIAETEIIFDMNDLSQHKCKVCLKCYSNLFKLKQHFLRVHAPKDFVCSECSRSYGSAALLTQHRHDSHSQYVCADCGKSYTSRSAFNTHMQSHELKQICQTCGKAFKNKSNLRKHILLNICDPVLRKNNLEKKYVCDYCSKAYSGKSTLRAHIKFEHGDGKVHICSWCNKKFNAISRLNAHIVTHTQEKKFSCEVCGGRYVTRESLLCHTRIHTGEKPYQCDQCDKRFLSSSRRAEHIKRHHLDPMIECDICHSKFRARACLKRHKKRHFDPNSRLHYAKLVSENTKV